MGDARADRAGGRARTGGTYTNRLAPELACLSGFASKVARERPGQFVSQSVNKSQPASKARLDLVGAPRGGASHSKPATKLHLVS